MATLYRKYRPQTFKEVVGQNHIKLTLEQEIKSNQLAHAYLFCGPRAVGKTTLARVLAKSLNCTTRLEGEAEPCNECQSCQDITIGRAMDIIEIDAASHTGVDNVRENVIANARLAPSSLKYKVFIIDEVHMLSTAAFNALLKIMEEPPANVVFVLCTTEVHKIPTTIISRCQRFDFKKISIADIVKKLEYITQAEGLDAETGVLEGVARQSGGHMRDAESILGQIISLAGMPESGQRQTIKVSDAALIVPRNDLAEVFNFLEFIAKKDAGSAINLVNRLLYDGFDLKVFLSDTLEVGRQILLAKINPQLISSLGLDLGESLQARLIEIVNFLAVKDILKIMERLMRLPQEMKDSLISQLPLEMAAAELCLEKEMPFVQPLANVAVTAVRPAMMAPVGDLNMELINSRWSEFLTRVKRVNHSLSFVLKVCQPLSLNGKTLCLAFKHKLHKDRISEMEIKKMVEEVLAEVYNQDLILEAILDESLSLSDNGNGHDLDKIDPLSNNEGDKSVKNEVNDEAINNILKSFGGKVVG